MVVCDKCHDVLDDDDTPLEVVVRDVREKEPQVHPGNCKVQLCGNCLDVLCKDIEALVASYKVKFRMADKQRKGG